MAKLDCNLEKLANNWDLLGYSLDLLENSQDCWESNWEIACTQVKQVSSLGSEVTSQVTVGEQMQERQENSLDSFQIADAQECMAMSLVNQETWQPEDSNQDCSHHLD